MNKKIAVVWVSLAIVLSFIVIIIEIAPVVEAPTTWYVDDVPGSGGPGNPPEDFTSIQDAINASGDGDIVFVYNGTYYENVIVNKTITIIGESLNTTKIDCGGSGNVVRISANWVNITGLTTRNSEGGSSGIHIESGNNRIYGNNISNNGYGIFLESSSYNMVDNNIISTNSRQGIYFQISSNTNTISGNYISNNNAGIDIRQSSNHNTISNNIVSLNVNNGITISQTSSNNIIGSNNVTANGFSGISISWSSPNNYVINNNISANNVNGIGLGFTSSIEITGNNVIDNPQGIYLDTSSNNKITNNNITSNSEYGVYLSDSTDNMIYHNNFNINTNQAYQNTNVGNVWDDGYPSGGNYWSDWTTPDDFNGPNQDELWGDGIVDNPKLVDGASGQDNYPVTNPNGWPGNPVNGPIHNLDTREDFVTIQDAIYDPDTLNGHTIVVLPGTYYENILINKTISLTGHDMETTIIDGGANGNAVEITADKVNLSGFMIINGKEWSYSGLEIISDNNNIYNNNISSNLGLSITIALGCNNTISNNTITLNERELWLTYTANNTIKDNIFISNYGFALYLGDMSSNNTISDNVISNNDYGIALSSSANNNTIFNNTVTSNFNGGISLSRAKYNSILYNNISNNGYFSDNDGVYLEGTSNIISGNLIDSNGDCGITIHSASKNIIHNNTISSNDVGIYNYYHSDNTIISDNTISFNEFWGIYNSQSRGDEIRNNVFNSNGNQELFIVNCENEIIINNTMNGHGILIFGGELEEWNSHVIENNIVNNKPLYYYKDSNGINVPDNFAQVIMANCTDFTIQDVNIHDVTAGIQMGFSSYNHILNNLITATNYQGIGLTNSDHNNISGNSITQNMGYAIRIYSSLNNIISQNMLTDNSNSVHLFRSRYNSITNNNLSYNTAYGIFLWDSMYNDIYENDILFNNQEGIYFRHSSLNNITFNTISFNNASGIFIFTTGFNSWENNISGNLISSNNGDGIYLRPLTQNSIISGNIISSNGNNGIHLEEADNSTIINNIISFNKNYGISIEYSEDNIIYHNRFIENTYQAYDSWNNLWDNGYPNGGNYWSDYSGQDEYSGINQDIWGSDGIGDSPYIIDSNSRDNYPLLDDKDPPAIHLNSPLNNSVFKSGIMINFTVVDLNLESVEYSINDDTYIIINPPYLIDSSNWIDGNYKVVIKAIDTYDNINVKWFEFNIDTSPPQIDISSPANNSIINVDDNIDLSISDINLNNVTYSINNGTIISISEPYKINTKEWSDGVYYIIINADDQAGNVNKKWFIFIKDTTIPEIILNSPLNDTYLMETSILDFEISDENLDNVSYSINMGSYTRLEQPYDIDTGSWVDDEYIIIIKAEDKAGNSIERWFIFRKDITAPYIDSTSINDDAIDVSIETEIIVEFNEPMDTESVEDAISISPYVDYSCTWSNDNKTLTITCNEPLYYETLYQISISTKGKDIADWGLESKFELEFTTVARPKDKEGEDFPVLYLILTLLIAFIIAVVIIAMIMSKKKKAPVSGAGSELFGGIAQVPQTIQFNCSNCNNLLQVTDTGKTQNVTCSYCSTPLVIQSRIAPTQVPQSQPQVVPQPETQLQSQQPTIQIACPKCYYKFYVVKTGGPIHVQCPNCGAQGTMR